MADRVLTAEMVLSGKDAGVSDMLARICTNIDKVSKQASHTAEVQKLGQSLASLDRQMAAVDKMATAQSGLKMMNERALTAAAGVDKLKAEIAGVGAATPAMTKALAAAEAASTKATSAALRQAEAVSKAEHAIVAMGIPTDHAAVTQERLARAFTDTAKAAEHAIVAERKVAEASRVAAAAEKEHHRALERRSEIAHRNGAGHLVTNTAAAYVSAHGTASGIERAAEAGAELQDTRLGMQRAGIDAKTRSEMEEHALQLSRRFANVSQMQIMDLGVEIRSVLSNQEEVGPTTEVLAAAKSVLDAGGKGHERSEGLGMLVKGAESIGAAQNPERLKMLIDSYVKAIQVMGKTINPEQIYQFDKYAKSAGATMSDRFLMTTGLSLSQEMGGSTAANDIFHAQKDIVGGFQNKHVPLKEMARLGLIDHDDIEFTKTGEAKGIKAGHKGVHDASLAQTDLDLWVYKTLLPALEKKGIKDTQAQLAEVSKIFTGGESDVISKLITQRSALEYHASMFPKASGIAGAELNKDSATTGLTAFNTALTNLMSNATVEAMAPVGRGLYIAADGLNRMAMWAKEHPDMALGTAGAAAAGALGISGWAATQLLGGFGLPGAATHLEGAAVALDAAAGRMGAGGAVGSAAHAAEEAAGGAAGTLGIFGRLALGLPIAGAGAFVTYEMLNRDQSKAMVDGGHPDVLPSDSNLGLPGVGEDAPSNTADAAKRAADAARDASAGAVSAWGWIAAKAKELGFGDRLHADAPGVPLPPERPTGYTGTGEDGNILRRNDETPATPHGVTLPAVVPLPVSASALTASTMLPADAADRMRERLNIIQDLNKEEQDTVFRFGALNDSSGVLKASFGTLDTGSDSAAQQIALLGVAARTVSGSLAGILAGGGGSGGGGGFGVIQAAYHPGGGSFGGGGSGGGMSPLLRGAMPRSAGGVRHASTGGDGGPNPYADGPGGGTFVPPVGDHLTAGMRNNNLGNIGWFGQHTPGLLGPSNARDVDHSIGKFATQEDGIRAAASLALHKYMGGRRTAWDLIAAAGGWTPGALGPGASVNVARAMGLGNRDDLHLDQPGQMVKFLHGLAIQEHGPAGRFYDVGRIQDALGHKEHPALAAPALKPRVIPAEHDAPAHVTTARLEEKMERMVKAVERGGLHRIQIEPHRSLVAKKVYQRGSVGSTIA